MVGNEEVMGGKQSSEGERGVEERVADRDMTTYMEF